MAKPRHNPEPQETSPRGMLAILAIGALLVAGLVVWALTRTVEPTENPATSVVETATPAPALDTVSSLAVSPDERRLAVGTRRGLVLVFELRGLS